MMKKSENISETELQILINIKIARQLAGLTQEEIAVKLGIKRSTYAEYERRIVPDFDTLTKISEITGTSFETIIGRNLTAEEKSIRKPKIETDPEQEGIIFVPISAQAGYSKHYLNPVFVKSLQKIYIPGMPYRGERYRIFEVDGDSMEPTLKQGYHVFCEFVEHESYDHIANFYVYVVVTEDRIMLKRLFKKSATEFAVISDNEEFYPQFVLHIGDVKELWQVKRKMDWEMAPPKKFEVTV
ncbi:helix-turn-helix domain-containing protein [Danxiaibacter flavus]|uniref:Helix-turn-helix domain-containing protein n=1 Tax=Danxiaibacter flavus TaxID=3049108 RepID=A0ABV3ZIA9_9BACT|nr:helix-turn-helix domain-containing protein [Chitinophagaceae bacterium DXS]